jgi:hypothetical protein
MTGPADQRGTIEGGKIGLKIYITNLEGEVAYDKPDFTGCEKI